jgi:hypothetical protein
MAYALERALFDLGHASVVLDDEGFGMELSRAARLVNHAGLLCLCPLELELIGDGGGHLVLSVEKKSVADLVATLREEGFLSWSG